MDYNPPLQAGFGGFQSTLLVAAPERRVDYNPPPLLNDQKIPPIRWEFPSLMRHTTESYGFYRT